MIKVKICGIKSLKDAIAAAEYGADALGFVFYGKSPRFIEARDAAAIIRKLPPFITPVALFVNAHEDSVKAVLAETGIEVLQFHGDETPDYASSFSHRTIKALRIKDEQSIGDMHKYDVNAILADAYSPDAYGGTGNTFNWDLLSGIESSERIILAGGLGPENVAEAIKTVRPYAVDVSSGVEVSPGVKDHGKLRRFIEEAKSV
jgi:phosphoribosylanthranilate isomerase